MYIVFLQNWYINQICCLPQEVRKPAVTEIPSRVRKLDPETGIRLTVHNLIYAPTGSVTIELDIRVLVEYGIPNSIRDISAPYYHYPL